ncbi:CaiB/BaiF CoA transferase family protein [Rhodococcus koreensis]
MTEPILPLHGVKVVDLSALLPGPLASLMLSDAGADVVKIERPGTGDEMREYEPKLGEASANYAVLNRGKRAYAADLKDPAQRDHVLDLVAQADVVIEQFRPGVVDRLGLGYEAANERNPRIVYCSITGYGPTGERSGRAGHDLNYLAESGLLGVVIDERGAPSLPVSVLADITGGTYPAVVNILLALRTAERTGEGCHLQISMAHNLQLLAYGYFATHQVTGEWPRPGAELLTGGSPRYHLYPTADHRYIACAALEDKFWNHLVELIELAPRFWDDKGQEQTVIAELTAVFSSRPASHWEALLEGEDVCTVVVATWDEAVKAGLVDVESEVRVSAPDDPETVVSTLPSPISPALRTQPDTRTYPQLSPLPRNSVWN